MKHFEYGYVFYVVLGWKGNTAKEQVIFQEYLENDKIRVTSKENQCDVIISSKNTTITY